MKKLKLFFLFLISMIIISCNDDDKATNSAICEDSVIISKEQYVSAPADGLTINDVRIDNDCLHINFSASGCDGSSWKHKLLDSGDILESLPPQRNLRVSLDNNEDCDAYITKEISYDISDLQVEGENQIALNFSGFEQKVVYEY